MRAAVIPSPGAAPVATEFAEPQARPGLDVVEVVAAGIHPIVRSLAAGAHYASGAQWPMIPGVDGVVRAPGGGLAYAGFAPEPYGTLAERVPVPMTIPLPAGADPVRVAAGMNPGLSSWLPLSRFVEDPGAASVLVLGATGSSGRLAVQNCRERGIGTVVAAGRDATALAALEPLGAIATTSLEAEALAAAVAEHRPTLVLDYLWGSVAEAALAAFGGHGLATYEHPVTYVEIGSLAGASASIPSAVLRSRAVTLLGSGLGSVPPEVLRRAVGEYAGVLGGGGVQVTAVAYPLDDVAAAWADTSSGHRAVVVP